MQTDGIPLGIGTAIPIHILENLAVIAIALDMETHEIVYGNEQARRVFGDLLGKECWRVLRKDQSGPCSCCPNNRLLDPDGRPLPPHQRRFQDPGNGRWYDAMEMAVREKSGRLTKILIAADTPGENRDPSKNMNEGPTKGKSPRDPADMVVMCCNCHKVRDTKGRWKHPAIYIEHHSGRRVSHGICSACIRALYPEIQR